jgi:hypothetical protein
MMNKKYGLALGLIGLTAAAMMTGTTEAVAALRGNLAGGVAEAEFFKQTANILDNTLSNAELLTYGMGGLGAIGLGVMAFFGKFQWTWFFGLVGGLVLIAGVVLGIQYVTGVDISGDDGIAGKIGGGQGGNGNTGGTGGGNP